MKINHTYDLYMHVAPKNVELATNTAAAEDNLDATTEQLTEVLHSNGENKMALGVPAFSDAEVAILQELAERREMLDIRTQEIDKKAVQLKVAEEEIDRKLKQLKEYEKRLGKLVSQYSKKEQENVSALVKLYSSMKPKDAARIFNTMNLGISTAILKGMKPSASSAILSQMDPEKAQAITAELMGNNI